MFEQGIASKLKLKVTELIFPEISLGILKVYEELKAMFATTNISLQCWNNGATIRNNVATLCCAKNCRCESSRVTSP